MTRKRISAHYAAAEFDCHDGTEWPPAARAALEWWAAVWGEPLRREFGPVHVTSGYRTEVYNRRVGGAPLSFHRYDLGYGPRAISGRGPGVAADVIPDHGTVAEWSRWATSHQVLLRKRSGGLGGVRTAGRLASVGYPRQGFIHLDTGPARSWVG